jgi:methionyl-tRNA formyltransferase
VSLRLAFMGTSDFAVPALTEIVGQGHSVAAVYARAPRPAGRGMQERRSPVHEAAARLELPVFTPVSLRPPEEQAAFAALDLDVAVVVAYGLILPKAFLEAPTFGCLNIHASLLPRWRGAAPIQRAIMAGDAETGVTIMRMDEGLDTGAIAMTERLAIGRDVTAGELRAGLAPLGADLIVRALAALAKGALDSQAQPAEGVTYAEKIDKSETRIDWTRPAVEVHNRIRGLSPSPGAWCEMEIGGRNERVKVLRSHRIAADGEPGAILGDTLTVACGTGAVELVELQRSGGKAMAAGEFLRGLQQRPERMF